MQKMMNPMMKPKQMNMHGPKHMKMEDAMPMDENTSEDPVADGSGMDKSAGKGKKKKMSGM
jgi:hypothetical protein